MARPSKEPQLWVINISHNLDVSVGDLRITIRKGTKVNLLDKKHYHFTDEQIKASVTSGSIYKKRHLLTVREVINITPSMIPKKEVEVDRRMLRPIRHSMDFNVPAPHFEELDVHDTISDTISDEQFAAEQADVAAEQHAAVLPVDNKDD